MEKAPDAFRTISEVAAWLDTPAHVLRFWESRFPQIKPVKRAGGRRYYRREDMALLGGIKFLLHEQGLTIRGVQKILSEQGVRHVASLSVATPGEEQEAAIDGAAGAPQDAPRAAELPEQSTPVDPAPAQPGAAATTEDLAGGEHETKEPQTNVTGQESSAAKETSAPEEPAAPFETPEPIETATSPHPGESSAPPAPAPPPLEQSELAFDQTEAMPAPHSRQRPETGMETREADPPSLLAARLRAGARIAAEDMDTVRALTAQLASLRARMSDRRNAASGPR